MLLLSLTRVNSATLVLSFSPVLDAIHHRYQFPHDLYCNRTHRHHKERRKDTKEDREDQFHTKLGGFLLRHLARLDAHEVGVRAQALRDAGTETVGLNQHRDQLLQIVDPGTLGQVAQRLDAALTGLQLEIHQTELFADL